MCKLKFPILLFQILLAFVLKGQAINEFAANSYLRHGNAQAYMSPFLDVMGASVNSLALSYDQPDTVRKFFIYIGVSATAAFIPSSMKSFDGVTEAPFSPQKTIKAPTVFGDNNTTTIYDDHGNGYTFSGGFDITQINLVFPIIEVGTFFHTNFSGRFFAIDINGDLKHIEIYGIGFNHFISDYWNAKNYFVSVGASFNQYKLGDYLKARHFIAQLTGGRQIKKFNYWLYAQWNKSPYEFYYEDSETGTGTVKIHGENNFRIGAGCGFKLGIIHLTAEASAFKPVVASAGIGLQF